MHRQPASRIRSIIIIVVCLVSIILVGSSVAILANYSNNLHEGAGVIGLINSNSAADDFKKSINTYRSKAETFGESLLANNFSSVDDFSLAAARLNKDARFSEIMFIRYFKDGVEYSLSNEPFDMTMEAKEVIVGSRMEVSFCAGVVSDRQYSISAMPFCIPLKNCAYADCVVLFFPVDTVVGAVEGEDYSDTKSQIITICSSEGEILSIVSNSAYEVQKHNNIYEFLRGKINDKSTIDSVKTAISDGSSNSFPVTISGQECILVVSGIKEHGTSPFAIIALYRAADIYNSAYSTVSTVLGELAIFFIMLIFAAVYFIVSFKANERKMRSLSEYNEMLDCPNRVKFEQESAEIIRQNPGTKFAIIVIDLRHFDYMTEHIGQEQMTDELKRMRDFYAHSLLLHETYGYAGNGRFLLLLHYKDEENLAARIKNIISHLGTSRVTTSGERITLSAYGGIYRADAAQSITAAKMIDCAIQAENATKYPYDVEAFRFYNESLHSSNTMNEYIEVNMQSALDNHLFKVFYQAKFNIDEHRPDGCEALVRWYNPETDEYMQPGIFLPLFEENRFIVKVDKYVYEQVCIYMSEAVAQHKPLYPVSVNVSRITASEPDFLDYYISIKNKYNIADNFLTIEFTESFAFEDYSRLRETVNVLHKNGFKCSIDDFGSGFSSYNILKELPMDEIKLDRFFIDKGFSDERDFKVLSSVIRLGRELNMKVTQEGVETKDQLLLLKKLGCNVIQGYYYSKPLVQSDYDDFLNAKVII